MATRVHREAAGARARRRGIRGDAGASTAALAEVMGSFAGQRAPAVPSPGRRPQGRTYTRVVKSVTLGGVDAHISLRVEVVEPGRPADAVVAFTLDAEDDSDKLRQQLLRVSEEMARSLAREMGRPIQPRAVWNLKEQQPEDEA